MEILYRLSGLNDMAVSLKKIYSSLDTIMQEYEKLGGKIAKENNKIWAGLACEEYLFKSRDLLKNIKETKELYKDDYVKLLGAIDRYQQLEEQSEKVVSMLSDEHIFS
ncbi:MAG: hypothetical protein NC393_08525 [Clostridium sp.]|nr:hypothetical protein [Clostridium sp.]MCM1207707.1 hypothetical protein [Ruminococcus sp.]